MADRILIVDESDNILGTEDKEKCHDGKGILHRAFLAIAFNDKGEVLIAKRSKNKRLWPEYWDATVASHVREGETYEEAARKRVYEELGIKPTGIKFLFKFTYHTAYEDVGSENEVCAVLACTYKGKPRPSDAEISETKLISHKKLSEEYTKDNYTPWTKLAVKRILEEKANTNI